MFIIKILEIYKKYVRTNSYLGKEVLYQVDKLISRIKDYEEIEAIRNCRK